MPMNCYGADYVNILFHGLILAFGYAEAEFCCTDKSALAGCEGGLRRMACPNKSAIRMYLWRF
jgi:hypothetical protein